MLARRRPPGPTIGVMVELYLTSYDLEPPLAPRRCALLRRVRYGTRDDFALVSVDPPFATGELGAGMSVGVVALASRHQGYSLFSVIEWPLHVYVCLPEEGRQAWPVEPDALLPSLTIAAW